MPRFMTLPRNRFYLPLFLPLLLLALTIAAIQPAAAQGDSARVLHNTRDTLYRSHIGAIPTNTPLTLRISVPEALMDNVALALVDYETLTPRLLPMNRTVTTPEGSDFYEITITTPEDPGVWNYWFVLRAGDTVTLYEDDTIDESGYSFARKGGTGVEVPASNSQPFGLTVYDPEFATPAWMHDAVIYQIFPDRFRNGNTENDPEDGSQVFYQNTPLEFHETWNTPVEDPRSDPNAQWNRDFYGGDLDGITEKLSYLQELGVTALYLNPIFTANSNHRYDTVNYAEIDPILGTQEDWNELVAAANEAGIRIILDGVFNHASSDSPYFDRYNRFDEVGACEDPASRYRTWFVFRAPGSEDFVKDPCADDGQGRTNYDSWFGFDTLPKFDNNNIFVRNFFYSSDTSVTRQWLQNGAYGWRLDAPGPVDDGRAVNVFWEEFRDEAKRINPDAVLIAELWDDVSPWLTGTQFDSTTNYRVRRAILGYTLGENYTDADGRIDGLTASEFDGMIQSLLEDYPDAANFAMMNILGSHDVARLRYVTNNDSTLQRFAVALQYALPGAPTIYYGDEIGLNSPNIQGNDDPYNRAPYPWDDTEGDHYRGADPKLYEYYQRLAQIRAEHPSLRTGDYSTLLINDETRVYAFMRSLEDDSAVIVANGSSAPQDVTLNMFNRVPNGTVLRNVLTDETVTVRDNMLPAAVPPQTAHIYVIDSGETASQSDSQLIVNVTSGDDTVDLTWDVESNFAYVVYRSYFPDSGFEPISGGIGTVDPSITFSDPDVENGTRYYYQVRYYSEAGMIIGESDVVSGAPGAPIEAVRVLPKGQVGINRPLDYTGFEFRAGVDVTSEQEQRILAEAILATLDVDPAALSGWQRMTRVFGEDGAYRVNLRPAAVGDYAAVARFSTDGGSTWTYTDSLPVTVRASSDTTPPAAPANVRTDKATAYNVILTWDAVDDAAGYLIYKGRGRNQILIGQTTDTTFRDIEAFEGSSYTYQVTAIDTRMNESEKTPILNVQVLRPTVDVTFTVTVPENTPAETDMFIAGDFKSAQYPLWNPAGLQMEQVDDTTWTITLSIQDGARIEYKYVRGDWLYVEKAADCSEMDNRVVVVRADDSTTHSREDTVINWRDVGGCP
jgi:glycosidase/fibronectin type 3 domain-containing protein